MQLDQTSLGLPTRDYYLQPANTMYLQAYTEYLTRVASLLGASVENVTKDAQETINFETSLAKVKKLFSFIGLLVDFINHII